MRRKRYLPLLTAVLAASCGGSNGPTQPTPTPGFPVSGFVFYDENANGVADAAEVVRLPGVTVTVGGVTATTTTGGLFTVTDVPSGLQAAAARPETLPVYFDPGVSQSLNVPADGSLAVPAVLTLGTRARPNVYLAFGDSITWGEGSPDLSGYRDYLRNDLRAYWGKAAVEYSGVPGTRSDDGAERAPGVLSDFRPAYLLILYGTNDWNDPRCRDWFPCYMIDSLRAIIHHARGAGAKPILGTIPPVNPDWADHNVVARNDWVRRANTAIRAMAKEEQVAIAEVHGDFLAQPSLPALFFDEKHPNVEGYRVIARSFFNAITKPYSVQSSARFDFAEPGR